MIATLTLFLFILVLVLAYSLIDHITNGGTDA